MCLSFLESRGLFPRRAAGKSMTWPTSVSIGALAHTKISSGQLGGKSSPQLGSSQTLALQGSGTKSQGGMELGVAYGLKVNLLAAEEQTRRFPATQATAGQDWSRRLLYEKLLCRLERLHAVILLGHVFIDRRLRGGTS